MIRNGRTIAAAVLLSVIVGSLSWRAAAQTPAESGTASVVATVAGRRVTRAEYDRAAKQALADYERLRGAKPTAELEKLIRRQALERLIRAELLVVEGLRAMPVSETEIDAEFRTHPFFTEGGTFSAERFQRVKAANSPEYRSTVAQIRGQIASRKLAQRLEREYSPDPTTLRSEVERSLSRVTLEYIALRLSEFDGSYPEPRESEVLDFYRAHERDFVRVERAALSVIQVGDASIEEGRATADSLIAEIRGGLTFEGASAAFGGARSIRVTLNDFPAWWPADPATKSALFGTARAAVPGAKTVLPQVFRGRDGWLVVRLDAFYPAGTAPLRDVAREIRRLLREDRRDHAYDRELHTLYDARKSMLKTTAYRMRFAAFDTAAMTPGEPNAADIERYYRARLADFSSYDPKTATIRTRSLDEVREDVKARWRRDRRVELARLAAARLEAAWRAGRRDRVTEAQAVVLRDAGPLPLGVPADTGYFGRIAGDSLTARSGALGTGMTILPRGTLVFHVHQAIRDYVPSFEDYRPLLLQELQNKRTEQEETGARALYERDPQRWAGGKALHYGEVVIPYPDPIEVPLTRREVERFHLANIDRYSAPEQVHARHILVSPEGPGSAADAAARQKAEQLLQRVRAGEDFAELARRYSDDPPTQTKGGDLGFFGRGAMLEEFERAAFALKPGEMSEPVRTEAGWHIIRVVDRLPLVAEPLDHVYSNVGSDAASEKADRMVQETADSLLAVARTPAQLRAIAKRRGYEIAVREVAFDEFKSMSQLLQPTLRSLAALKPGQILLRPRSVKGLGVVIAWLDSIGPARNADWQSARERVMEAYRHGAALHALYAKRAEIDSLGASGWSLDSIATMLGGFERVTDVAPGKGIVGLGGAARVDSLAFGDAHRPALAVGQTSDWVELTRGVARIRLAGRTAPGVDAVSAKTERQRRLMLERGLQEHFARLSTTHSVRILDTALRDITLPPIPEAIP